MSAAGVLRLHSRLYVAATLLVVAAAAAGLRPSESLQLALLVALVALIGLPHGAVDPLIARAAGLTAGATGWLAFLFVYVAQAIATVAFWLLAPAVALPVFLAISAWHFSTDWDDRMPRWQRLAGGASVILAPVLFHPAAVEGVFAVLSSEVFGKALVDSLRVPSVLAVILVTVAAALNVRRDRWAAAELMSIPLLALLLPPLAFFVVYFCGLHSPRHLVEVTARLRVSGAQIMTTSAFFTLLSLGAAATVFFVSDSYQVSDNLLRIVFIGLAALTVPHMILLARAAPRAGYRRD